MTSSAVIPSFACNSGYSGVARFAPTSSVKITTPAITSRAVVEASQPQRSAVAGRMRSSLKTVMAVPLHEIGPHALPVGNTDGPVEKIGTYRMQYQ
ncbi:hypothetical protein SRABI128_04531 [Microbacterium sp. Bi128]|nr:hypothetical protein SRABI128_04531 [Microbacterium sp. Bi128]